MEGAGLPYGGCWFALWRVLVRLMEGAGLPNGGCWFA